MLFIPEKQIRAFQADGIIRIYQAYSDSIADVALESGFVQNPHFKKSRMTWIKPSFLWMMYRAGWGKKDSGQKRILAIDITKEGFDWALNHSCSSHKPTTLTQTEWEIIKQKTPVRIQWDPERSLLLQPLPYRTIQLGLSGEAVELYMNQWIQNISEVTGVATEIHKLILQNNLKEAASKLPIETIYTPEINQQIEAL